MEGGIPEVNQSPGGVNPEKCMEKSELDKYIERCEFELYVEKYFGLDPASTNENTVIPADFGVLCDLLCGFKQELEKNKP